EQCLRKDSGQAFAQTRMNNGVDSTQQLRNVLGWNQPREHERLADAQPLEVGGQAVAENPVSNPDELDFGVAGQHDSGNRDDVIVPLEFEQARDRRERDVVVRQPQLAPNLIALASRIQKRVRVHTAVDRHELLGPPDTGGERLSRHGIAYADDGVSSAGGPPFECNVETVLERRFEWPKWQSMNCVDDCRDVLVPCRRSAENAGLGAVRVHNLRPKLSKD